jgi:hypothetical protein
MNPDLIPCKYSVVRFFPSAERDEFLNVGIILHAQDRTGRVEARFLQRFSNLKWFVPERERSVISGLRTILKDLELGLENAADDGLFLDKLFNRFTHQLQFSEVRQTLADEIMGKVEDLFDLFVSVEGRERETRNQVDRRRLKADFRAAFKDRKIAVKDDAELPGARIANHVFDFLQITKESSPKCLQTLSFDITNIEVAFDALRALRGSIDDVRKRTKDAKFWAAIMPPKNDGAVWKSAAEFLLDAGCTARNLQSTNAIEVVDDFASA